MVKEWTLDQWEQLQREQTALPPGSISPAFIDDYVRYEAESLRCRGN